MSRYQQDNTRRHRSFGDATKQITGWLSDTFGVSHGMSMALLVVGFVIAPLLTVPALLTVWYWTGHPEKARWQGEPVSARVRRAVRQASNAAFGHSRTATAPNLDLDEHELPRVPPGQPSSAASLRERFEALDRRAKHVEEVMASEEYRLEHEFRRIDN